MQFGKIFSYDSTKGRGIALLENAQQVEFSISNWENVNILPEVGQMISWFEDKMNVIDSEEKEKLIFQIQQNELAKKLEGDKKLSAKVLEVNALFNEGGSSIIPLLQNHFSQQGYSTALINNHEVNYVLFMEKYTEMGIEKIQYKKNNLKFIDDKDSSKNIDLASILNAIIKELGNGGKVDIPQDIKIEKKEHLEVLSKSVTAEEKAVDGMGIASLVTGIMGFFFLGIILGPVSLALGFMAPKPRSGFAIAGLVIGGILTLIVVGAVLLGLGTIALLS